MNNERAKEYLEEMRVEYFCGSGAYDALGLAINSLDRDISILKALEDVRAELYALWDNEPCVTEHSCDKEVYDLIDRKIAEVMKDEAQENEQEEI